MSKSSMLKQAAPLSCAVMLIVQSLSASASAADNGLIDPKEIVCSIVAEIAVEHYCRDTTKLLVAGAVGGVTKSPMAVEVWWLSHELVCSPAGKTFLNKTLDNKCQLTIELVGDVIRITAKEVRDGALFFESLSHYEQMRFLEISFSGYDRGPLQP
jgi:hypothetical protein